MDILKILRESTDSLIPEDLDFFETELATNEYDDIYIRQCKARMERLRMWMSNTKDMDFKTWELNCESDTNACSEKNTIIDSPQGIVMGLGQVLPETVVEDTSTLSPVQILKNDLNALRGQRDYKSEFKKYVKGSQMIDATFLDKHFSLFEPWEMNAIVSVKPLPEEFLEKYFGAIDHDKIARYQLFSEGFFMKHFAQMNAGIVLLKGNNEWRKKRNRSKQLDVFLRLKGVKI